MARVLTRQEMEKELGQVFTPEQAACLVNLLDAIRQMEVERAADTRELRQGLIRLTEEVRKLTVAQARTEERLAQFEQRTEERFAALAEAQARTEERLAQFEQRTEERFAALAEAQARTEERLAQFEQRTEERFAALAEAQARTEERLAQFEQRTEERLEKLETVIRRLIEAQTSTEYQMRELVAAMERTNTIVAALKGWQLEHRYHQRAAAYFGSLLRRVRVFSPQDLEDELEPYLSAAEIKDFLQLDLLLSGQPRHQPEAPPVWLAVEISAVVDLHDVKRAQKRAEFLRRAGYRAIPTVAGEQIAIPAKEEAALAGNILVLQDGSPLYWDSALAAALAV